MQCALRVASDPACGILRKLSFFNPRFAICIHNRPMLLPCCFILPVKDLPVVTLAIVCDHASGIHWPRQDWIDAAWRSPKTRELKSPAEVTWRNNITQPSSRPLNFKVGSASLWPKYLSQANPNWGNLRTFKAQICYSSTLTSEHLHLRLPPASAVSTVRSSEFAGARHRQKDQNMYIKHAAECVEILCQPSSPPLLKFLQDVHHGGVSAFSWVPRKWACGVAVFQLPKLNCPVESTCFKLTSWLCRRGEAGNGLWSPPAAHERTRSVGVVSSLRHYDKPSSFVDASSALSASMWHLAGHSPASLGKTSKTEAIWWQWLKRLKDVAA